MLHTRADERSEDVAAEEERAEEEEEDVAVLERQIAALDAEIRAAEEEAAADPVARRGEAAADEAVVDRVWNQVEDDSNANFVTFWRVCSRRYRSRFFASEYCVLQYFSSSTIFAHFCTAPNLKFKNISRKWKTN